MFTAVLYPSAASDIERLAGQELRQILAGGQGLRDVLGLIVASGGSLTIEDLAQLTGLAPVDLIPVTNGSLGRAFTGRPEPHTGRTAYSVAHETLRSTALDQLGAHELDRCRRRIHRWAQAFRSWPDHTPAFFVGAYPRLLLAENKRKQVVKLAGDPERHRWLLAVTYGDAQAFEEIQAARELLLSKREPDLGALAVLGVRRRRLRGRNWRIPVELPLVRARLGEFDRAEALAGGLLESFGRDSVVTQLADIALAAGHRRRALNLLALVRKRMMADPAGSRLLNDLVILAARAGDAALAAELNGLDPLGRLHRPDVVRALTVAGGVEPAEEFLGRFDGTDREELRGALVEALVAVDLPAAVRMVQAGGEAHWTYKAWETVLPALVEAGSSAEAEALVEAHPSGRARAALLRALAAADDRESAVRVAAKVNERDVHTSALAKAVIGGREAALEYVRRLHPVGRPAILTELMGVGAREDQRAYADAALAVLRSGTGSESARRRECERLVRAAVTADLLEIAESAARCVSPPKSGTGLMVLVAQAWASRGRRAEAVRVARTVGRTEAAGDHDVVRAWTLVATQSAESGDWAAAEAALSEIRGSTSFARAASRAAEAAARRGEARNVEALAGACDSMTRLEIVHGVLRGLVSAGRHDEAEKWAAGAANRLERRIHLGQVATLLAGAGQRARAEELAPALSSAVRPQAFTALAEACRVEGDRAGAARWAAEAEAAARAESPYGRSQELYDLCVAFLSLGELSEAERMAGRMNHPLVGGRRLACELLLAVRAGDVDRVLVLAGRSDQVLVTAQTHPDYENDAGAAEAKGTLAGALRRGIQLVIRSGRPEDAETALRSLRDEGLRRSVLPVVVHEAARAGDFDRAQQLVTLTSGVAERARVVGDLVEAAVGAGEAARAERLARATSAECRNAEPLIRLAVSTARRGDRPRTALLVEEAESAVARYGAPHNEPNPPTLAVAYAFLGEDDAADEVTAAMGYYGDDVRRSLITEYVRLGRFDRARTVVEATDRLGSAVLRPAAVRTFAAAGRFDLVEWVAALSEGPGTEGAVLAALAEVYAAPDGLERLRKIAVRAEEVAGQAPTVIGRRILLEVADGLAKAGDVGRARQLLARYLAETHGTGQLDVVGRISPETVRAMAEAA